MEWERARPLLERLLELPEEEREAALARECDGDERLRERMRALLAAGRERHDLFEPPVSVDGSHGLVEGDRIGPWLLVRELGEGGMGRVWLVERADSDFRQRAALKVVKAGMDTDAVLRRFRRERRLLANLEHPGIVRLLDGGATAEGRPYLVVELVEGRPIDEHAREHGLGIDERLELFAHVCDAVDAAHRLGVVHRDLKPSNVLVTGAGEPKVLDFGIAKLLSEEGPEVSLLTRTGERLLTPRYAAPEQVLGQESTPATDVYSLGVLLFELLTGRPPYEVENRSLREIETAVCEETPLRPSAVAGKATRRRLAGDLDVIALRALAKEPGRRYRDAGLLARDVRRHLAHEPIRARPDSTTYRVAKFVRRNRLLVGSTLAVVAALAFGLVASERQRQIANQRAEDAEWASYVGGIQSYVARLSANLDIEGVANLGTPEQRSWEWRHLNALASSGTRELYRAAGKTDLAVDGSGQRLALRDGENLVVLDASSGRVWKELAVKPVSGFALSPLGDLIAYCDGSSLIVRELASEVEVASWRVSRFVDRVRFLTTRPMLVVADGEHLFLVSLEDPDFLQVLAARRVYHFAVHPDEDRVAHFAKGNSFFVVGIDDPGLSFHAAFSNRNDVLADLAFSPSGRYLAVTSENGVARVWDLESRTPASLPLLTNRYCQAMAFHPERDELLVAGDTIRIWNVVTGRERILRGGGSTIRALVMNPAISRAYTSYDHGSVLEWITDRELVPRHHLASAACWLVSASPRGTRYAATATPNTVLLVETGTGDVLARREVVIGSWTDLVHTSAGDVVCAGRNGVAVLSGDDLRTIAEVPVPGASCLALSPDGATLYVGTATGRLIGCATSDWLPREDRATPFERIRGLAVHPDGERVTAVGMAEVEAQDFVISMDRWIPHRSPLGWEGLSVCVSPDGRQIAVLGSKGLRVSDAATGALLHEREASNLRAARFSPDGKRLLFADSLVLVVVDTARWETVIQLRENERSIQRMDFAPDGTLLTCDLAGDVVVWRGR